MKQKKEISLARMKVEERMIPNRLALIIVSFNGEQFIRHSVNSAICESEVSKIIVVDNASTDSTLSLIPKNPKVELIRLSRNIGFGLANNIGILKAINEGFEWFFLLNQDAYLESDCISELMEIAEGRNGFGILSPLHLNGKGDSLDREFATFISRVEGRGVLDDALIAKQLEAVYVVPFVNAAAWLVSKECLEKVGGFDPAFFLYGEDDNYCHRVHFHGFEIGVVPSARIYHDRENRGEAKDREQRGDDEARWLRRFQVRLSNPAMSESAARKMVRAELSKSILHFVANLTRLRFQNLSFDMRRMIGTLRVAKKAEKSRRLGRSSGIIAVDTKDSFEEALVLTKREYGS
jgi:GT2 family glycosyltransferase